MYSELAVGGVLPQIPNSKNYHVVLVMGNWMMLAGLPLTLVCIAMTYTHEEYFSMSAQIAAHIGTLLFSVAIKLGYVMRCVGRKGLGESSI